MAVPKNELAPVNPRAFRLNPYIQDLSKKPKWTISTSHKAPYNAKTLVDKLANGDKHAFDYPNFYRKDSELVTLPTLDAALPDMITNRAFRLNTRDDHLLLIDVEPTASNDIVKAMTTLPVAYAEHSMHGGYHLLLPLPHDLINDTNRYLLDLMAVKGPDNMFELLLNRHFVTFTRRVLPTPHYDYRNPDIVNNIRFFIRDLVKFDQPRQQKRLKNANHTIATENITTHLSKKQTRLLNDLKPYIQKLKNAKSVQDYNNDYNRYEFGMAEKCLYYASYIQIKPIQENPFFSTTDPAKNISNDDCIELAYAMLLSVVPHREKHDTKRNGLPLLLYDVINVAEKSDTIKHGIENGKKTNFFK